MKPSPPNHGAPNSWLLTAGLALLTLGTFWPVTGCAFLNFDDDVYVTNNRYVQMGLTAQSLRWALTHRVSDLYHPLAPISFMVDHDLFGQDPFWSHFVNLVFHILNVVILFHLLRFMTAGPWRSAGVAALFAVHPLRVESVAWIVERKDVLAMFFGLLAIAAYAWYSRKVGWKRYVLIPPLMILSLLAKPLLVTLPLILLVLDYWPLRKRGGRVVVRIVEKLPLLLLSAASVLVTLPRLAATLNWLPNVVVKAASIDVEPRAQPGGIPIPADPFGELDSRARNAVVSYVRYLGKMFDFRGLTVWYPEVHWANWQVGAAALLLAGITAVALAAKRWPWLAAGWLWYVVSLLPVCGIFRIGAYSIADRYTYFPMIGILIAVVWSLPHSVAQSAFSRRIVAASAAVVLSILCIAARLQIRTWETSFALWAHALAVTSGNWKAHSLMGNTYLEVNDSSSARREFEQAVRLHPYSSHLHYNLAVAEAQTGDSTGAMSEYRVALDYDPSAVDALNALGTLEAEVAEKAEKTEKDRLYAAAVAHHRRAVEIDPSDQNAHVNLGLDLVALGQPRQAIAEYQAALALNADNADAQINLGLLLFQQGVMRPAVVHLRKAVRLRPNLPDVLYSLGVAQLALGEFDSAVDSLQAARQLVPDDADIAGSLAAAIRLRNERLYGAGRHD